VFYDRDYYNATLDERFRLQYSVLTFRFSSNGTLDRNGFATVQWNDAYLSKAGLDSLVATGVGPRPEAFLINNNTKPPHSNQWSLGVRRVLGNYTLSATYTGVRSFNGLTYIFGNRRTNGNCCYQNPTLPFSNVLLSSDEVKTWYDAVYLKIERPYRGGHDWAWGGGLSYSFGKAQAIGGDLFSLDYVFRATIRSTPPPVMSGITSLPTGFSMCPSIFSSAVVDAGFRDSISDVRPWNSAQRLVCVPREAELHYPARICFSRSRRALEQVASGVC